MPVLDFTEIPRANSSDGKQDTFELFAKEYMRLLELQILVGPDRGQDGGRDLIVSEQRSGILGNTEVKWLVSCKHKAHSGSSVLDGDEHDIMDRVRSHGAVGFIGFYSTVPSSGLSGKLERLKQNERLQYKIIDPSDIESLLLVTPEGRELAKRYFPVSFEKWELKNHEPSNLFYKYEPLACKCCGKDLLKDRTGIIVFIEDLSGKRSIHDSDTKPVSKYIDIYWSCKGVCDRTLKGEYRKFDFIDGWEDISDIVIPGQYMRWLMAILNRMHENDDEYTDHAFAELKKFILRVSQLVLRRQSQRDIQRILDLMSISF